MELLFLLLANITLPDEQILTQRLRDGDSSALGRLYDVYGPLVYRLALRIVKDHQAAEDIVQDTFIRLWERADRIHEDATAIGPWIATIGRNRALDYLRSKDTRQARNTASIDLEQVLATSATVEKWMLTKESAQQVSAVLQMLSQRQRQVIELAYYGGLSQSQIADHLQQPLGTVKSLTRAALLNLRTALTQKRPS